MATEFSWSSFLDFTGIAGLIAGAKAIRSNGVQSAEVDDLKRRVGVIETRPNPDVPMARHDERIKCVERDIATVVEQLSGISQSVARLESGDVRAAEDRSNILAKLDTLMSERSTRE